MVSQLTLSQFTQFLRLYKNFNRLRVVKSIRMSARTLLRVSSTAIRPAPAALKARAFHTSMPVAMPLTAAQGGSKEHMAFEVLHINRTDIGLDKTAGSKQKTSFVTAAQGGSKEHLSLDTLSITRGETLAHGFKKLLRVGI